jgi:hypothetical protein
MPHIDPEHFYQQALTTARATLCYVTGSERTSSTIRQCAREALQEAHTSLSQAAFFACLDALGGHAAVLDRLSTALYTTAREDV